MHCNSWRWTFLFQLIWHSTGITICSQFKLKKWAISKENRFFDWWMQSPNQRYLLIQKVTWISWESASAISYRRKKNQVYLGVRDKSTEVLLELLCIYSRFPKFYSQKTQMKSLYSRKKFFWESLKKV